MTLQPEIHVVPWPIKAHTLPAGWSTEPELIDAKNRYYKHTTYYTPGGGAAERRDGPPAETLPMCDLMLNNPAVPATAHFVGQPTRFLSLV